MKNYRRERLEMEARVQTGIDQAEKALYRGDSQALADLIANQPELIKARDRDGRTLLMLTCLAENSNVGLMQLLIDAGAEINVRDTAQQWSALHFAATAQRSEMVKVLLENGAEVDILDCFGNTPLWRAVMNFRGDKGTIQTLLLRSADPDRKNHHGVSARDILNTSSKLGLREILADLTRQKV
jgi:ankyrin repeat protein